MDLVKLTNTNQQEVIDETLKVLKEGGLVVFPSDTVYGLLADSTNPKAITKLLSFKDRPVGRAISVFMADKDMVNDYISLSQNGSNVVNNLLPGPFTIVAKSRHQTDSRLEAENGTLGIRIPDFPLILDLVKNFKKPITATSANLSGKGPVYSISALEKTLSKTKKSFLNLVIDGGRLPKNRPSTVIDTTTGQLKTLRLGDLLPKTPNTFISNSEEQTKKLARFLATKFIKKTLSTPIIFLLEGDLGAGKTVFAKGLGQALGITEEITSPTFNILNEYELKNLPEKIYSDIESIYQNTSKCNKRLFIHGDFYRIEAKEELFELDFFKNLNCGNVYAIEWPERLPAEMISALKNTAEIVYIKLKYESENKRIIEWGH